MQNIDCMGIFFSFSSKTLLKRKIILKKEYSLFSMLYHELIFYAVRVFQKLICC